MAQFRVYQNPRVAGRERIPFVLDVQSDVVELLPTRLVIPLVRDRLFPSRRIPRLNPGFSIKGHSVVLSPAEMGAVAASALVDPLADLSAQRTDIIAALDLLFTGI
ncbi:CcdB family protein [Nevskia soli]|uniref:CcdB family protein n=1 Tax=Nevskia soli TaxID=418856 RepID=UPI0004A72B09|nr:CcdB family protein [Nevskia soli]